jgi:FkbM family methyltransferase
MISEPVVVTLQVLLTPNGRPVVFSVRDGTNDAGIAISLNTWDGIAADEYRMQGRHLSGWAIDLGAHIGAFAVSLALDNPDLRVIAIEGVPENAALAVENAERNGVADRVTVVTAFAAAPGTASGVCHYGYRHVEGVDDGYISAHRFIGGTWGEHGEDGRPEFAVELGAVNLDGILARFGIDEVALLKTDCEGCEWTFLDTPAVSKIARIVGEYHGRPTAAHPVAHLRELLPGHDVTPWSDQTVDIGLFEAVRR